MDQHQHISDAPRQDMAAGTMSNPFRPSTTQGDLFGNEFILFHHWLGRIAGLDDRAVLLLSHLCYLATKWADQDGWFFQPDAEIQRFTLMARHKQIAARKRLVRAGVIERLRDEFHGQLKYRVNFALIALLAEKRPTASCQPKNGRQARRKTADSTSIEQEAAAPARVRVREELLPLVLQSYRDLFGRRITLGIRAELEVIAARPALTEKDVVYAFSEAAKGTARGLPYVITILDRLAKPEPVALRPHEPGNVACPCLGFALKGDIL